MLSSEVRRGSECPPNPVQAVAAWIVGCHRLHQWLGTGLTLRDSGERGRRADLIVFPGDVWADGHDLVVEDVMLFYLAVD